MFHNSQNHVECGKDVSPQVGPRKWQGVHLVCAPSFWYEQYTGSLWFSLWANRSIIGQPMMLNIKSIVREHIDHSVNGGQPLSLESSSVMTLSFFVKAFLAKACRANTTVFIPSTFIWRAAHGGLPGKIGPARPVTWCDLVWVSIDVAGTTECPLYVVESRATHLSRMPCDLERRWSWGLAFTSTLGA